jgi:hypothetical protein
VGVLLEETDDRSDGSLVLWLLLGTLDDLEVSVALALDVN